MRSKLRQSRLWKSGAVVGVVLLAGMSGCKSNQTANTPAPIVDANGGPDPASVNNAPVSAGMTPAAGSPGALRGSAVSARQPARVLGQQAYGPPPNASGEQYPEQYPAQRGAAYPPSQPYPGDDNSGDYNAAYDQQVDAGQQALYADQPPPPLPVYQQPELTDPGDQWTPGYWSYAPTGYYWVPGAWVAPPFIGALWTPGYWGFYGGRYRFHHGYWGNHIGFYGGVPYGFGYTGHGYEGGYWNGNRFYYNNAVNRVNTNVVHNVYARNVGETNNRTSFNGPGGWNARPTASDAAVLQEQRVPAMQVQRQRAQEAASNRQQFAAVNQGRPGTAVLAQRQSADRVAPAAMAPINRPAQAGSAGAVNGGVRTPQEQGRGQTGFNTRGGEPQAGDAGRPAQAEQTRPGNQLRQSAGQPRIVPGQDQARAQEQLRAQEQTRPAQNQAQPVPTQPQRQLQGQRPVPSQAQQAPRPQPQVQARPEVQAQPVPRPQPQVQPRPEVQVQPRPQVQPQAQPRPQVQPPHPQPQAQPHPQPAQHEESHPHR